MNAKELEAYAKSLEGRLKAVEDRGNPSAALAESVGAARQELTAAKEAFDTSNAAVKSLIDGLGESLRKDINGFGAALDNVRERVAEARSELVTRLEAREVMIEALEARIAEMEPKVHATNKSAPSKRNMTDEDALVVLTGECKELTHKEAAEKVGLTYAQVYSARGEFTFKHVHKELRDKGWKNPWVKK